jgi:hypothetical protein
MAQLAPDEWPRRMKQVVNVEPGSSDIAYGPKLRESRRRESVGVAATMHDEWR